MKEDKGIYPNSVSQYSDWVSIGDNSIGFSIGKDGFRFKCNNVRVMIFQNIAIDQYYRQKDIRLAYGYVYPRKLQK